MGQTSGSTYNSLSGHRMTFYVEEVQVIYSGLKNVYESIEKGSL